MQQSQLIQYMTLEEIGYIDNHKTRILGLLWDLEEHPSDEVVKVGGKQYNARVLELRREGWKIVAIRKSATSFNFQLLERIQN